MKLKVMKFGGTSVAEHEARITAALRVISAKEQGYQPVVVVSAIGRKGAPYATDTLIGLLSDIDSTVAPDPRELDLMMACGEILSAVVFAHTLKTLGHPAQAFRGGQAGIRTDGVYGNARILSIHPVGIVRSIESGRIPVVCGFQGVFADEGLPGAELTTLGRGGSDTTASALGAALRAEAVEIYTDVNGVKTADPSFVPEAPTYDKMTYDEVAEMAHQGTKVLHPRAAEIAMRFGIPLWVKNVFTEEEGTEIVQKDRLPGTRVTGVTHSGKLVHFMFDLSPVQESHRRWLESRIFSTLAKHGANLFMINMSPGGIGFAVPREQMPLVERLFDGLVMPCDGDARASYMIQIGSSPSMSAQMQWSLLSDEADARRVVVETTEGLTMVSVVGNDYMQQPGVFHQVLSTLQEGSIPVHQVADGDISLSCLIPESEVRRAVSLLHEELGLSQSWG